MLRDANLSVELGLDDSSEHYKEYASLSEDDLFRTYNYWKEEKERAKKVEAERNERIRTLEGLIAKRMEGSDKTSVQFTFNDKRVSISYREEPYVVVTDRKAFNDYATTVDDLRWTMTPPWQTTNTHGKEQFLKNGEPVPGTELRVRPIVSLRRLKSE